MKELLNAASVGSKVSDVIAGTWQQTLLTFIRRYKLPSCYMQEPEKPMSKEKTLIYFDPPYYGQKKGEVYSDEGMSVNEHHCLASALANIRRPWLLSYDDCKDIRELYQEFNMLSYNVRYSVGTSTGKSVVTGELLISNRLDFSQVAREITLFDEVMECNRNAH